MRSLLKLQVAPVLVVCWLLWCSFSSQDVTMPELGGMLPHTKVTASHRLVDAQDGRGDESRFAVVTSPREPIQITERREGSASIGIKLSEWRAFHLTHPRLGQATEASLLWLLNSPTTMQDTAASCAGVDFASVLSKITLAADIVIQERDIFVEEIECEGERDGAHSLKEFCRCLLGRTSQVTHIVVPDDIPDRDLASYRGHLALAGLHIN